MPDPFWGTLTPKSYPQKPQCDPDMTMMTLEEMKAAVVIAWALVWSVVAVSLVSSVSSWILLVGAGVLPTLVILWIWHQPARLVSANIREARK